MPKLKQTIVNYKFTILTLGLILFLSLSTNEKIDTPKLFKFEGADKIIHFGMYAFLTLVYLIERTALLRVGFKTRKTRWFFVIWIVLIGACIELIQPIVAGREKELWDFISNTAGVFIAYFTFNWMLKHYNFNKTSSL